MIKKEKSRYPDEEYNKVQRYMNRKTGSVGTYDDWWYENEEGKTVNAVDLNEVVQVTWNSYSQGWISNEK